jgi:hypothetical protein
MVIPNARAMTVVSVAYPVRSCRVFHDQTMQLAPTSARSVVSVVVDSSRAATARPSRWAVVSGRPVHASAAHALALARVPARVLVPVVTIAVPPGATETMAIGSGDRSRAATVMATARRPAGHRPAEPATTIATSVADRRAGQARPPISCMAATPSWRHFGLGGRSAG